MFLRGIKSDPAGLWVLDAVAVVGMILSAGVVLYEFHGELAAGPSSSVLSLSASIWNRAIRFLVFLFLGRVLAAVGSVGLVVSVLFLLRSIGLVDRFFGLQCA